MVHNQSIFGVWQGVWSDEVGFGRSQRSTSLEPAGLVCLRIPLLANSAMMSTLTAVCQREDETVRERSGHPPSYAVAKKMKSLTLNTQG